LAEEFGDLHILDMMSEFTRLKEDELLEWSVARFYTKLYYMNKRRLSEQNYQRRLNGGK
jgi:hypothetical protein